MTFPVRPHLAAQWSVPMTRAAMATGWMDKTNNTCARYAQEGWFCASTSLRRANLLLKIRLMDRHSADTPDLSNGCNSGLADDNGVDSDHGCCSTTATLLAGLPPSLVFVSLCPRALCALRAATGPARPRLRAAPLSTGQPGRAGLRFGARAGLRLGAAAGRALRALWVLLYAVRGAAFARSHSISPALGAAVKERRARPTKMRRDDRLIKGRW